MTIPANDAFTFGLAHDTSRRSPSSPRVFFSTPPFSQSATIDGKTTKSPGGRRRSARRQSKTIHADAVSEMLHQDDRSRTVSRKRLNGTAASLSKSRRAVSPKPIDWEIPRKALHSSIGFFTIYLYVSQGSPRTVVVVLSTALAVIVPADFLRLRYPRFEKVYEQWLGFLMRESEKRSTNGVIWYIIGCNFALSVFPLDIAVVAILILSWADTAASTFGRMFGAYTPPLPSRLPLLRLPLAARKSLAGFIAASVTGSCIAVGFWKWIAPLRSEGLSWQWDTGVTPAFAPDAAPIRNVMTRLGFEGVSTGGWLGLAAIGIVSGIVAGVAEALDLGSLDDNLTLPIIAGGCLWGFLKFLGLFS